MFLDPLTSQDLYWIGYIRADGYIHTNKITGRKQLIFTQKELEPVKALADLIGNAVYTRNDPTNYGPSTKHKVATSGEIARRLDQLGVKTNLITEAYGSKHFWRGLLDGDGSLGFKKRSGSPDYPFLSYIGSTEDMTKLSEWLSILLSTSGPTIHNCKSPGMSLITLGGRKASYLAEYLYKDEYSALSYKKNRAKELMSWTSAKKSYVWNRPA